MHLQFKRLGAKYSQNLVDSKLENQAKHFCYKLAREYKKPSGPRTRQTPDGKILLLSGGTKLLSHVPVPFASFT